MPADTARLRATVEHLASFDRPSASDGERRAGEWIRGELEALGVPARVEEERAVGSMAIPLALLSALGAASGLGGRRAAPLGLLAAAAIVDDVSGGPHIFRRLLPHRSTWNVTGTAGDPDADDTLVFVAHHDAATGGLIYRPELTKVVADAFPEWYERQHTQPQVMRLVAAGPALAALGALSGASLLRRLGTVIAAGSALAFLDIATRTVVPGANDNLSAVAVVLELARRLHEQPVEGVRVLLVSTGSEESFMEGMQGFGRRHFGSLPRATTEFVCIECVGSPQLCVVEAEGMLRMRPYTERSRDALARAGEAAGVDLRRGLRTVAATDALIALRAGYPTCTLGGVDETKFPSNYHWPSDTPENLSWESVEGAARVCEAYVRQMDGRPIARPPAAS
jgi:acetylornithine deacetylase/succinyl-diaminopimelate desuccinylase-like protein